MTDQRGPLSLIRPQPLPPPRSIEYSLGTAAERREKWIRFSNQGYGMDGRIRGPRVPRPRPITSPGSFPVTQTAGVGGSDMESYPRARPTTNPGPSTKPTNSTTAKPLFECPICWSSICKATVTHCGHMFCNRCILAWKENHHTCPLCHSLNGMLRVSRVFAVDRVIEELGARSKRIHQEKSTQTSSEGGDTDEDPAGTDDDSDEAISNDFLVSFSISDSIEGPEEEIPSPPAEEDEEAVEEGRAPELGKANKSALLWVPLDDDNNN